MIASAPDLLAEDLKYIESQTQGLWEPLRDKNIFVTGGTGFFGRWLLESFASANRNLGLNSQMVVLSRNSNAFAVKAPHLASDEAIRFVTGDVRTFSAAAVQAQLPESAHAFDFVIHAATETTAKEKAQTSLETIDTIVQGTRATLEFAVVTGARRFLLTSSGAVYGAQPSEVTHVPEEYLGGPDCTRPSSAYGEGKRAAELLCGCFHEQYGIEPLIARCFAFVGPFLPLDAHFAVGNFIRDALAGGPIRIAGDGTPYRSYLYAADLVICLWTILLRGKASRPYNVGSARDLTIAELAEEVRAAINPEVEIQVMGKPVPGIPPARYVPANRRALTELGLNEGIELSEAIRRTADMASASS